MRNLLLLILLAVSAPAFAGAESVLLVKVLQDDDKLIIQRRNGDRWMITKGIGAFTDKPSHPKVTWENLESRKPVYLESRKPVYLEDLPPCGRKD